MLSRRQLKSNSFNSFVRKILSLGCFFNHVEICIEPPEDGEWIRITDKTVILIVLIKLNDSSVFNCWNLPSLLVSLQACDFICIQVRGIVGDENINVRKISRQFCPRNSTKPIQVFQGFRKWQSNII